MPFETSPFETPAARGSARLGSFVSFVPFVPLVPFVPPLFFASLLSVVAVAGAGEEPPAGDGAGGAQAATGGTSLEEARESLRTGDYGAAAAAFAEVLARSPGEAGAARGRAEALAAEGKYAEALLSLKESIDKKPSAEAHAAEGRIHLRRGALREAEAAFRAALGLEPDHIESLNRLGETLSKGGRTQEARASWERIVDLYQAMSSEAAEALPAEGFVEMGLALIGLNRYHQASKVMFEQAQEKDESSPALLLAWGRALMDKYNWPGSRECLREAIDENRRFADALVVLADNQLIDFQLGTDRYELAEKNLERALDVNPSHAEAYAVRGSLWLADGNVAKAAADFEKSVELDPSSMRARGLLAACHYLAGDEEKLEAAEKAALAVNPKGAELFHAVAGAIEQKFRYRDAVRYADRALAIDPDYWRIYHLLAINCLRTGEEERGRKLLEKSWAEDRYNVWVKNTRTLLEHMDKNHRQLVTERFSFKLPSADYEVLSMYLAPLLEEAFAKLSARYQVDLSTPVFVEAFSDHKWFSARTIGLPGFAASGACFGNLVTLTTPRALPQNWGAVAWHEFAHVVTLHLTEHRVPRWLTEGLSVLEEGWERPQWARQFEREIADAYGSGRLLPLAELDFGFSKPKYPNQILISYFQGCLISMYIREKWSWESILSILRGYRDGKSTAAVFKEVLDLSLEDFDAGFLAWVGRWVEANGYEPSLFEENLKPLELAVELDPESLEKRLKLAWAFYSAGGSDNPDTALHAMKVLEKDPQNGDAHAILGLDAFRSGRTADAKKKLERALELGTRFDFRSHATLGLIAQKDGEKEKAIERFEKAKAISPRAGGATFPGRGNLYYFLHALYNETGKEDLAVAQMEQLARFAVEDPTCRSHIVSHYLRAEGDDAARKAYRALEELIYIKPFDRQIHERLAALAARLGEHDAVIREYGYLLSFPDTNPKVAYLALARAHAAKGNSRAAVEHARRLLEIDAGSDEARRIIEEHGPKAGGDEPAPGEGKEKKEER
jgi:tetratricopeptide (TPR) repeat protein